LSDRAFVPVELPIHVTVTFPTERYILKWVVDVDRSVFPGSYSERLNLDRHKQLYSGKKVLLLVYSEDTPLDGVT
jgi:hypothetical protein